MKHHSLSKVLKRLACVLAALVIALALFLMYLPWAADYKKKKRA